MAVIDRPFGRADRPADRTASAPDHASGSRDLIGSLPRPVLIYLLTIMIPVGFYAGPLYMTLIRLFLLIVIVPLTIQLLRGKYGRLLITDICMFLHMGWAVLALAVNNPSLVVQNIGSTAVEVLGAYLIGRACIRTRADFIALCKAIGITVCITLPLALIETNTGIPYFIKLLDGLPVIISESDVGMEPRMGLERVQVMMTHPIHYGLFASTAFSLTVVALKDVYTPTRRVVMGTMIALCVFLSLSSGALLPTIVQIFLIVWAAMFRQNGRPWLVLGLLALLAYVAIDLLSNRTPLRVFMSYATFSAHNAYWRGIIFDWGMKSVWGHPLYGIGLNDWVRPSYMHSGSMDNFWLVMAVRYGIPGFLFLAIGYGLALGRIMFRNFGDDVVLNRMRRAWVFTFLSLTLTLCTVHIWTTVYSYVFFLFGTGMWMINTVPIGSVPDPVDPRDRRRPVPRQAAADTGTEGAAASEGARRGAPPFSRFPPMPGRTGRKETGSI